MVRWQRLRIRHIECGTQPAAAQLGHEGFRVDDRAARQFFEENFRPLVVQVPGTFTGYFEPEMRGSKAPSRIFTVPVYRRPPDLTADKPYFTRAEIEQGALKGKGLEIAWVQDPVALFEVQVQGSGRVHLAEGGVINLGFDGSNNRPYTAIANVLPSLPHVEAWHARLNERAAFRKAINVSYEELVGRLAY